MLPSSLSPHICILSSPDLSSLLESSSLPPLPQILQSFSPLPNVTTRSTSLASIPHNSFALRFSDLLEIETACAEDEDQRAARMIDWIGARTSERCAKWVQDIETTSEKEGLRTPWWDELRHCAEGDHIPSKAEGWNHPVSVILAVSTIGENPLQVITALHAHALNFPSWVDSTLFRYTLIVHPKNSPLSNQEAGALFNAVKKQFGLHSYILPLELPSPLPPPVPVPTLLPRLPPPELETSSISPDHALNSRSTTSRTQGLNTLRFCENDIQQTGKFTREFVVMSLVPWMEKCVLEWNENFTSTRRLPSRLFSSTRRLFGSPSPSPAPPVHGASSSTSSQPRSSYSSSAGRADIAVPPPSQQRRLAEFATILGDYKLAIIVWEAIRKDGKTGADVLPMLLSPSPTIPTYVLSALSNISSSSAEMPPKVQLRALIYAVRWESGIPTSDFLGDVLGGERWLVWAAGDVEETPAALLIAHAALLCARKGANRRAALWYLMAANKLEKMGIKPLTMYFLRKAHELYLAKPSKLLSPLFWESENHSPNGPSAFDEILSGIEHSLGRLLYTTGDVAGAVKLFTGLLRESTVYGQQPLSKGVSDQQELTPAKLFLEDFRVALDHLKSIANNSSLFSQLRLPIRIDDLWERREDAWLSFCRNNGGEERLEKSGKAIVGEKFWIDLLLHNPLDADINLSNFTVVVQEKAKESPIENIAHVEVIDQVTLAAREEKKISISVKPLKPTALIVSQVCYNFLSLLASSEPLSYQGRRLQDTAIQRQKPTYAADVTFEVKAVEAEHRLSARFVEEEDSLLQGEYGNLRILFSNTGTKPITEIWIVVDPSDELWLGEFQDDCQNASPESETLISSNSLIPEVVYRIPNIATAEFPFHPGDSKEVFIKLRAEDPGRREISLLLTYREGDNVPFQSTRLSKEYEVQSLVELGAAARPCESTEYIYLINLETTNNHPSTVVELRHITTLSPTWACASLNQDRISLLPSQGSRVVIGANPWNDSTGVKETLEHVFAALADVADVSDIRQRQSPPIGLLCNHIHKTEYPFSVTSPMIQHFIQRRRQQTVSQKLTQSFPQIPTHPHSHIFPLYNPFAVDILVFWSIPSSNRHGHVTISGLILGAMHASLKEIVEAAQKTKGNRSMYAETRKEKADILDAIGNSEWNAETDPLSVAIKDEGNKVHDFANGPYIVALSMIVRNYSLTHRAKFVLKFPIVREGHPVQTPYTGRTTFRGTLEPCQSTIVRPKLWVTRPGTYSLDSWSLTTEIYAADDAYKTSLRCYSRQPYSGETARLTISDIKVI